jgi:peptide/nickel transport system substrate-binding protein
MKDRTRTRSRTATLLAAALATTLAVAAATAQELNVGLQNMVPFIDPGRDHSNVGSQVYYNAFDTLIEKDHSKAESVWRPGLASSWRQTSPTTVELTLRDGVRFHNGDPLTADDVVFSLDRIVNATFPPYKIRQKDFVPNLASVEKLDERTIRITSRKPEPLFETLLNIQQLMIVPKKYMASLSGNPNEIEPSDFEAFGLKPVGTGPYRVAEFIPNQRVVYERFEQHWGDQAPFNKVTLRHIPELSSRITALKTGEVDLITNIPPDQIATIEADARLKVEGMVTPLFHVVIFNTQHPKMQNPKLRQALSLAIDRDTLNQALWQGKAVVPSSHTYPQYGQLYMPELKTFTYDPVRAKQLLAESGYDGTSIRFDSFPTYYTNGLLAAQAIREMWAAIGVKSHINVDDKWTGNQPEMMSRNWSNPLYFPDPAGSFGTMWAPNAASESEKRFSTDARYAETWERFRFSTDVAARKAAYAELMEMIRDNPPVLPLYQPYESYGMKKSVAWKPLPGHIPYVLDFRAGKINLASR